MLAGSLVAESRIYPIVNGVPRFVDKALYEEEGANSQVQQTAWAFGKKWNERASVDLGKTKEEKTFLDGHMLAMFQSDSLDEVAEYFNKAPIVLNAGCGMGWSEALYNFSPDTLRFGVDLSTAVEAAFVRNQNNDNVALAQGDILNLPFAEDFFDLIFSNGVVHHTPDPKGAVLALCRHLKSGGMISLYIYCVKPLVREMADREIRQQTTQMNYEDCKAFSAQMAALGKSLQQLAGPLEITQDIPLLGIKKGSYVPQTFIYDHFLKCYFN